jgi:hypothetical protein
MAMASTFGAVWSPESVFRSMVDAIRTRNKELVVDFLESQPGQAEWQVMLASLVRTGQVGEEDEWSGICILYFQVRGWPLCVRVRCGD